MDIDCDVVIRYVSEIEFVVCQVFIFSEEHCVTFVKLRENALYEASNTIFNTALRFRIQTIQIGVDNYDLSQVERAY
jgi:hypothetical protein